ncbi:progranulin-like isoform X2 [Heptranchias perlo]|uniref:progranulin-like isoform X2 n=1 Tax=Heptranchias perlo TaxID=212740 RepID=UPI00355A4486
MIQMLAALWLATGLAAAITCLDGSTCPNENTCCKKGGGGFACCPLPKAVCCSDLLHCCPENTTCDTAHSTCIQGSSSVPWLKKIPAIHPGTTMWEEAKAIPLVKAGTPNALTENICLDNTECPPEYTCMPTSKGFYGCCPLTEATVCKDWEHCCPKGYECDVLKAKCKRTGVKEEEMPLVSRVGNLRAAESELCGNMSCSVGYTCCTSKDFGWGCCPMKDAVCCDDDHCCPKDFKCDKARKTCIKPIDENVKAIICPDGVSECPDGATCCLLPDEKWGCCPLQKAVCCGDRRHCCPSETKCDLKQSKCVSQYGIVEMWKKFPAHRRFAMKNTEVQGVQCNGTVSCPDDDTCCKLASGGYGCCPMPNALCCEDHVHCCPSGYKCEPDTGTCYMNGISIPWLTKTPTIVKGTVRDVQCNGSMSCPADNTCCKKLSGDWGCCPIAQAVCCEDHTHCCPNGYTCNVAKEICEMKGTSIPMVLKLTASVERIEGKMSDVQCDNTSKCSSGNTCCRNGSGGWGCCPLPKAVCCEDHTHCCPTGYTCDVQSGSCQKNDATYPLIIKKSTVVKETMQGRLSDVQCDRTASCPTNTTCCRLSSGLWTCCPLPQAVCCEDHIHCCPNGYICDVQAGVCHKKGISIPLVTNMPTIVKVEALAVQCDDTAQCPSGTTCCKNASGQWACCPSPQAVCCKDKVHCCPNGYTCDEKGSCLKNGVPLSWISNKAAIVKSLEKSRTLTMKCNDTESCPAGSTCCKRPSGDWGCCPLTEATCCEDHEHCCPNGYTCNVSAGTCDKQSLSVPWEVKQPPLSDVKCDDTFRCQSPATCCKIASGGWACCPYEQATCCDDKLHCCPNGYTCDGAAGACVKRPRLSWDVFFPKHKKAFNTL